MFSDVNLINIFEIFYLEISSFVTDFTALTDDHRYFRTLLHIHRYFSNYSNYLHTINDLTKHDVLPKMSNKKEKLRLQKNSISVIFT